jgi:hypothetical protein
LAANFDGPPQVQNKSEEYLGTGTCRGLRAWMLLFIDYIAAKQIIASALSTPCRWYFKAF